MSAFFFDFYCWHHFFFKICNVFQIMVLKFNILLLIGFITSLSYAQDNYIDSSFRSPIGIPILLSGDFGELRSNHFHTGLDIKTNGKPNYRIYSVGDGFVSRINISHWGYGKAIYVDHPNGYTSVYAHLSRFPEKIEKIIRDYQYKQKTESVTLLLDSFSLPVKKSEIIAYSGNTGGSFGPHLHFEIRETKSENPINPLLFKFDVPDHKPPLIRNIKLYPFNGSLINKQCEPLVQKLIKKDNIFQLKTSSEIKVSGIFGVGLDVIDFFDNSNNKCGVFSIEMYLDGVLKFSQSMRELDFSTNRDINIHKDYADFRNKRLNIHKSFIHPNNALAIYDTTLGNGLINLTDTVVHELKYIVKDYSGNSSTALIQVANENMFKTCDSTSSLDWISENYDNIFENEFFKITIPKKSIYDSVPFKYDWMNNERLNLMSRDIPLKHKFILSLKLSHRVDSLNTKTFIAEITSKNKIINRKGEYNDGWLTSTFKSFGDYVLMVDTTSPKIQQLNFSENTAVSGQLEFKLTDDLSGLKQYDVWIDDDWVLSNYSFRNTRLIVPFNKYNKIESGLHQCRVEAKDERDNISELKFKFTKK
jgi:hypothetical protein